LILPHGGAIKVSEQPFVRVAVERHSVFNTLHQILELGANERVASIGSVNMQPCSGLMRNRTYFK